MNGQLDYLLPPQFTHRGCAPVDRATGRTFGSTAEAPPPGWLQRLYGIQMPPSYDRFSQLCGQHVRHRSPYG